MFAGAAYRPSEMHGGDRMSTSAIERVIKGLVMTAVVTALVAAVARAQDSASTPVVFKEKSHVSLLTPSGKSLLFEALPAAHFFFLDDLANIGWQKQGGPKFTASASFLPQIRMSTDRSSPVRTPGYRIRVNTDLVYLSRGDQAHRLGFEMFDLGLTLFGHYSNGQSGCRLRGYQPEPVAPAAADSVCTVVDAAVASKAEHNFDSGDFSTSYFAAAINWRKGVLSGSADPVRRQLDLGLEYQLHPLGVNPGGIDRELRRDFGSQQVTANASIECRWADARAWQGVSRVALLGVSRFGVESKPLFRGELEVSHVFDKLHDFGVFGRLHSGYDYYNIRFYERKPFVSVGIMWDTDRLDLLTTEAIARPGEPAQTEVKHCFR